MDASNFKIHIDCPQCGSVELGADSLTSMQLEKGGKASLSFTCQTCGSQLQDSFDIDDGIVRSVMDAVGNAVQKSQQAANRPTSINIQYTPLAPRGKGMMTFQLNIPPKPGAATHRLTKQDEAELENFHQMLESLGSVDEAIGQMGSQSPRDGDDDAPADDADDASANDE